ncbi:hypothetical protein RINTU1_03270 [Candidatus Regiella insecticola]|uniref:Uncharacterized protein n=1 Tax=Candidatus Regiella insecticola TaxID=138073 RepID=A0A6L2ZL35_9ENTR|nr:hypothetical protein RINTU1_03270 [Candidatus Regiella insecticola]
MKKKLLFSHKLNQFLMYKTLQCGVFLFKKAVGKNNAVAK